MAVNVCAEKTKMQTELFELSSQPVSEAQPTPKPSLLERTSFVLRLDQTIGVVLVLLVFYVLVFSWGVERGRRSAFESQAMKPVSAVMPQTLVAETAPKIVEKTATPVVAEVVAKEAPVTVSEAPKPVASVSKPSKPDGKYTIQHVTYVTQSAADREMQKFLKKGHVSFIIPSGRHLQVCIDSFQTRQEAIKTLKKLRTEGLVTPDAYVRPIQR